MATGYTHDLIDLEKPLPSTEQFLKRISRAMGLFIHQRDDSPDAPPRKVPEKSTYRDDSIRKAKEQLNLLHSMTLEEAEAENDERHQELVKAWQDQFAYIDEIAERIKTVRDKVKAWDCPDEIEFIKEFALAQIDDTYRQDVVESRKWNKQNAPVKLDAAKWKQSQIEFWAGDLAYQEREKEVEEARVEGRNETIQLFIDSVEGLE